MNVGIVFYIIEKTSSSRRKISKVKESARVIKRKLPSQIKFTKKQTNKYKQNKQTKTESVYAHTQSPQGNDRILVHGTGVYATLTSDPPLYTPF